MPDSLQLLPEPQDSLVTPAPKPKVLPEMRAFGDAKATRTNIYADVHKAVSEFKPISNDKFTLSLHDVHYVDPETISKASHKKALLTGATLGRRLKGTWRLTDNATGKVEERPQVVARVPHYSDLGTFVNRGNDYTVNHQQRLNSGVFARQKENGEIESHINILPGEGVSHRYFLDPRTSVFKMKLGQSEMPLMPLMRL